MPMLAKLLIPLALVAAVLFSAMTVPAHHSKAKPEPQRALLLSR